MGKLKTIMVLLLITSCVVACKDPEPEPDPPVVPVEKTYEMGSYYNEGGVQGIVYKVSADKKHGMMVSLDEANPLLAWAKTSESESITGVKNDTNGMANMEIIKKNFSISDFPAFEYCDAKNKSGVTGWYLPATQELIAIRSVADQLKDSLVAHGGTPFSTNFYWSSYENASVVNPLCLTAYAVGLDAGTSATSTPSKIQLCNVRAVRAF